MCYACIYSKSLLLKQLFAEWDGTTPLPLKYFYRYSLCTLYYFFKSDTFFVRRRCVCRIDFSIHMSRTLFFKEDRINIVTCFLLIYHSLLMFLYCRTTYVCYICESEIVQNTAWYLLHICTYIQDYILSLSFP